MDTPNFSKHKLFRKACVLIFFVFLGHSLFAQELYVRVSPNDCINCYVGFFKTSLNYPNKKAFKYLFPENFQGKMFQQFNKLYFHNSVSKGQVVFSDSLYLETKGAVNGLSGLILMNKGNVILASSFESFSKSSFPFDLKTYIDMVSKVKTLLDFDKQGISENVKIDVSYPNDMFFVSDNLFRTIFFFDKHNILHKLDLKTQKFQKLIKKFCSKYIYFQNKKNRKALKGQGKLYPEYPVIYPTDSNVYIGYQLPSVKVDTNAAGKKMAIIDAIPFISQIPIPDFSKQFTVDNIIAHSYKENLSHQYINSPFFQSIMGNCIILMRNPTNQTTRHQAPFCWVMKKTKKTKHSILVVLCCQKVPYSLKTALQTQKNL